LRMPLSGACASTCRTWTTSSSERDDPAPDGRTPPTPGDERPFRREQSRSIFGSVKAHLEHAELAERLRSRLDSTGILDPGLRAASVGLGAGADVAMASPCRELAATIAEASHRVTDQQVAAVREALGSDRAAFEVI